MSEPTELLYATDAYVRDFGATVTGVDREQRRVALSRTAFYPGGGGQPPDTGRLRTDTGAPTVTAVGGERGVVWHTLDVQDADDLPAIGSDIEAELDWDRRHQLMRTHTALHMLCGVIWHDYGVAVTGGNMEPGKGRLDFELDAMSAELGRHVQRRVNEEIKRARDVWVRFLPRSAADADPALIRTKVSLVPASVDPLRIIDITGLDRQADGGTHVASTAEVGGIRVVKTESKGKANKRIRLQLTSPAD